MSPSQYAPRLHCQKMLQHLAQQHPQPIYVQGDVASCRHDTDVDLPFRQESNMFYLTGCNQPGCHLLLLPSDGPSTTAEKNKLPGYISVLVIPTPHPEDTMWHGPPENPSTLKQAAQVDYIVFENQMLSFLQGRACEASDQKGPCSVSQASPKKEADKHQQQSPTSKKRTDGDDLQPPVSKKVKHWDSATWTKVLVLRSFKEKVQKAVTTLPNWMKHFKLELDDQLLTKAIIEARLIKTEDELVLMREASKISSDAHIALMKAAGNCRNERELAALFKYETEKRGCEFQAYGSIVGKGANSAILHYTNNNAEMSKKEDFVLVDAGGELHCYASDITRTYPVGGKFSSSHKVIYQMVLDAQKAVLSHLKAGVKYEDMHELAVHTICEGLVKAEYIKGDVKTLMEKDIPTLFFPHGLGHLIGLDVHDVGGYPEGVERIDRPGYRYLRLRRTLKKGMAVTVEPGVYFVPSILEPAMADEAKRPYLNLEKIKQAIPLGGVRIEDVVVITETGIENLVHAPKEIADIEKLMAK